ncbi:unnamed protein product, partial [Mesorhabditis belari]|uniref:Uncharacterized protein n=1 Tax=Mesorhabditis belari TaxID=2138241 RepID=A0AAF3F1B6_9BILA
MNRRYAQSFDEETIRRLQQNVGETRKMNAQVERAKDAEEAKQVDLENHLHKISATVSEFHDAINKSKRREKELLKQIESWVELLKSHKQMVEHEDARFQSVSEESEQFCDDLEFNIDLLKRKRISVDALVLDLARTREYHDTFIKQLRNDLKGQKNELEIWDKRLLDNKQPLAALAVLTSRLNSAHRDGVISSVSEAPNLIVQGTLKPVNPQPMKAQTMTLAPVLFQNNNNNKRDRHTSESSVEIPMEFESRAPTYFGHMAAFENRPHEEVQQRAKKSGLFITSQIREVLRTHHSSTNLSQKSPQLGEKQTKKLMEEISPQIMKKSIKETTLTDHELRSSAQENRFDSVTMSASRTGLFECLGHVNDPTQTVGQKNEKAPQPSQQAQRSKENEKGNVIQAGQTSPTRKDEKVAEHEPVPKEEKSEANETPPDLKGEKDPANGEASGLRKDKARAHGGSPSAEEAGKAEIKADGESSTPKEDKAQADAQKLLANEKKAQANERKENVQPSEADARALIEETDQANGQSSAPRSEKVQEKQELPVSNGEKAQANRSFVLDKDQVDDLADKLLRLANDGLQ